MFQDSMVGLSLGIKSPNEEFRIPWTFQPLNLRPTCCLEILSTDHPVTWHHILEEERPYVQLCVQL